MKRLILTVLLLLAPLGAGAVPLQSDCRGLGTIGTAVMGMDGTITLTLHAPAQGVVAYKKSDPQYARILSHIGAMRPGDHKPVPAFCN
jgi:hypothetical protein